MVSIYVWDTAAILLLKDSLLGKMDGISLQLNNAITSITHDVVQLNMGFLPKTRNPGLIICPIYGRGFSCGVLSVSRSIVVESRSLVIEQLDVLAYACAEVVMFLEDAAWMRFRQKYHGLQYWRYITKTERQVLAHIQQGLSNAEIADVLGMQELTLKSHKQNLYRKLGAHRAAQALARGKEAGLFLYCS